MERIEGGVTVAKGFQAASCAAQIKYKDRPDMAMIYSQVPCKSAGTFTTNLVKAAPVKWDREQVDSGKDAQAVTLSKSVITSSLTKAAIFGHDANWGRILCAMGYSGAQFDPEKVDLTFMSQAGSLKIVEDGVTLDYSEEEATKILSQPEVTVVADVKMGQARATAWGCDLTFDYVKINADYRS